MAVHDGRRDSVGRGVTVLQVLVLLMVVAAWWSPALGFYFSQDDFPLLATSHPGWVHPSALFLIGSPREYRPLSQHVFFFLNQLVFGLDPRGHHAATLAVHLASAVLVGMLARRWIARWALLPAGAAFALHPVHFFEVSWVSGVSPGACVLFMLLTLASLDSYLVRGQGWKLVAALAAAAAALLSKEDAVMLPALVTVLALARPARGRGLRIAAVVAPFWLLAACYLALRFSLLGLGLPSTGVYRFGVEPRLLLAKTLLYSHWLLLSWPFVVALAGASVVAVATGRANSWRPSARGASLLLLAAPLSVLPTMLVPSAAGHYLSFASAVLALVLAGLVRWTAPGGWRFGVATALALALLAPSWQQRGGLLASRDMSVPLPAKAALCREWVEGLRAGRELAKPGCNVVLRDAPLQDWERQWLSFLPAVAWDRPLGPERVRIVLAGDPEPTRRAAECSATWSLTAAGARYVMSEASTIEP
ncbi:MAG: hypothetical protein LAO05_05105 [Acidobacteriia bacterium]|nr:hypothetical protein [Terriglobia bacterium]